MPEGIHRDTRVGAVAAAIAVALAGCFAPTPPAGAPCGADGACPSGLRCQAGRCVVEGPPEDTATPGDGGEVDAPPADAPPGDAPPDALDLVGCADGAREGLTDAATYPTIAGCAASWVGARSLRAPATGAACGDDLGACDSPADACAPGWHLCGEDGLPAELTTRLTQDQCAAPGGPLDARFVAALQHCATFMPACTYELPFGCAATLACGEPVCCGPGCRAGVGCPAGVFAQTAVTGTIDNGCGAMLATDVTGVLCCR